MKILQGGILRVGVFWRSFGPYHIARFNALVASSDANRCKIFGVEVSEKSTTYDWNTGRVGLNNFTTLFKGLRDESVGSMKLAFHLCLWMRRVQLDVIYVTSFWPAYSLIAIVLARLMGVHVVIMTDSICSTSLRGSVRHYFKSFIVNYLCDAAFVSGSRSVEYVVGLGMHPSKVFIGYDAVDNDYFYLKSNAIRMGDCPARMGLSGNYLLSLGRFVEKKNLRFLISAYALASSRGWVRDNKLLFVGSGPLREALVQHVQASGLRISNGLGGAGVVEFRGYAQLEDIPEYYAKATAFILASTKEEWGLVINEAMASRCPVIVSRVVGCAPDLVCDGITGFDFDANDIDELANKIRLICCGCDQLREQLIDAAQFKIGEWGLDNFSMGFYSACGIIRIERLN